MKPLQNLIQRSFTTLLMGGAVWLLLPSVSHGGVYAKYDGVDGESNAVKRAGWNDVLQVDWGMHRPGSPSSQSRRRGTTVVEELTLTLTYDKAAPKLQNLCLEGRNLRTLYVDVERPSDSEQVRIPYFRYRLTNVQIVSCSVVVTEQGDAALQVCMSFREIVHSHVDRDGNESILTVNRGTGDYGLVEVVEPEPEAE